jgi:hypothetical protein
LKKVGRLFVDSIELKVETVSDSIMNVYLKQEKT